MGILIKITPKGFQCSPSKDKAARWAGIIGGALTTLKMSKGLASKLSGKLSWASSRVFNKLGRALLRPIFLQKSRSDGKVGPELRLALQWWLNVLQLEIAEMRPWSAPATPPLHLFCDARGSPPHVAAVLFYNGSWLYTHMAPPVELLHLFGERADNQIMGLELLSISLGSHPRPLQAGTGVPFLVFFSFQV